MSKSYDVVANAVRAYYEMEEPDLHLKNTRSNIIKMLTIFDPDITPSLFERWLAMGERRHGHLKRLEGDEAFIEAVVSYVVQKARAAK